MDSLNDRREAKSLRFAKGCLNDRQMKRMFPLNKKKEKHERFRVNHARTSRYQNSTIIHMQKLLNSYYEERRKITKKIDSVCSRDTI